jgi:Domain of unknown function (DUF4397)
MQVFYATAGESVWQTSSFQDLLMRRLLAGCFLALVTGCGGNGGALEPGQLSALRLYNASPDSPPVNVFLRGNQIARGLAYGHGQFYIFTQPGAFQIEVRNAADDVLLDYNASLAAAAAYTFAITGPVATPQAVFLVDDTTAAPTGSFKIRMIQLAPLGPAMDLYLTGASDDLTTATPAITGIAYTKASSYVALPVGNLRLRATQAGTKTVLWDTTDLATFTTGEGVSLFVIGASGSGGGGAPYSGQLVADHS